MLQTYATQAKFEAMGYEAEIVDYVRPNAEDGAMIEEGFEKKNLHGIKKMLYIGLKKFEFSKRNRVCIDFLDKYCKLTRRYKDYNDLRNDPPAADVYCTGSDQTWNAEYNGGVLPAYFLNFAPEGKKKIGYAVSIGRSSISKEEENETNLAGKSMFGHRKFYVIRNTIDTNLIYYSEQKRNELRKELSIKENDFVYGTVCRQTYQKKPYFLIDVFEQIALRKENAKFVWAGTGELESRIKQYAESKKLGSKILFIGNRDDMAGVYSMMDCFILPSRYEGLGIVFVEAQACGVPVYASDVVPKDVMMTRLMHYISLKKTAAEWAEIIVKDNSVYEERSVYKQKIIDAKYDRSNNNDLLEYYESLT